MTNMRFAVIGIIILCVVSFFIASSLLKNPGANDFSDSATSTDTAVSATSSDKATADATGGYTIETAPINSDYPELKRPVVLPANFDLETGALLKQRIASTTAELTANVNNLSAWFALATYRKMIHDYEGARQVWEFLTDRIPQDATAFANLGELYHLYLKDYKKAEFNLKQAVNKEPANITHYRSLHELYKYSYKKDTTLAVDVLLGGMKKNPDSTDLPVLLGLYYRERGDRTSAKYYYELALSIAERLNQPAIAASIKETLASL